MEIIHRIKIVNKNVIINTSDSGKEVEDCSWFLKGRTVTSFWSSIVTYVEVDFMHKQEYGWWNAAIMTGNIKSVALITVHRIVDAQTSGVNSIKA